MGFPTKKNRHASIKWKIFLYLLGFCLLLLLILWLFQTILLENFYTVIKLNQVERETAELAEYVEAGDTDALTESVRGRGDLFVQLVNPDGSATVVNEFFIEMALGPVGKEQLSTLFAQVQAAGGALTLRHDSDQPPGINPRPEPPQGQRDGQGEGGGYARNFDLRRKMGGESLLCARLVTPPEGGELLLVVSAGITPVNATVETLHVQLWCISALMLVLATGLALLISRRVSRPIVKLNDAAGELARGNYDAHFPGEGYREVAQLAATLDGAARELSKTEELRRDLIANVSHDLRTPLTLITGYAEMMRDIPGENNPENMQVIIDEAKRLSSLVGDLLDLSRLQSGTVDMRVERFNLTADVGDMIERFAKFSEPEGFTVLFEPEGEAWVKADYNRITQVVYNFLVNAMTHGGDERLITVRQRIAAGRARVEVSDRGPGIEADQLPYIWDRYYKIDKVHKRAPTGSGLGLSIVKSILEQHPGVEYGVESTPGQGSTFWFSLPLVPQGEG